MKNETIVYGASDDLIEVVGNVREELYANYDEVTVFRVGVWKFESRYTNEGTWVFDVVDHPSGDSWLHLDVGEGEFKDYSEEIHFDCIEGVRVEKIDED